MDNNELTNMKSPNMVQVLLGCGHSGTIPKPDATPVNWEGRLIP